MCSKKYVAKGRKICEVKQELMTILWEYALAEHSALACDTTDYVQLQEESTTLLKTTLDKVRPILNEEVLMIDDGELFSSAFISHFRAWAMAARAVLDLRTLQEEHPGLAEKLDKAHILVNAAEREERASALSAMADELMCLDPLPL